jgi:hypothetical protein
VDKYRNRGAVVPKLRKKRPIPAEVVNRQRRQAPARPSFRDKDWMPPFSLGNIGETLGDLLKAQARLIDLFQQGKISPRQFRITDLALAARQRAISTRTWQENKFGNINETAKKPILVARERRIEKPPPGTPPKRPVEPTGKPMAGPNFMLKNGSNGTSTGQPDAEHKPAVPAEPAPVSGVPRPPRVLN